MYLWVAPVPKSAPVPGCLRQARSKDLVNEMSFLYPRQVFIAWGRAFKHEEQIFQTEHYKLKTDKRQTSWLFTSQAEELNQLLP